MLKAVSGNLTNLYKVMLTVGAVGSAAAIAGLGTYATFSSSTPAQSQQVASGTVTLDVGSSGSGNRLTVNASGLAAGDIVERAVNLTNSSNIPLAATTLTVTASTSSLLDTDTTDGLQMQVTKCSVPWTEAGTAPAYTYTCSGTSSTVLSSRPVVGSNISLSNLTTASAGTDNLVVKLTLPSTAGNSFQGKTSTLDYVFQANQQTGGNHH